MPMGSKEDIDNRIQDLQREIDRGWMLYGRYMDTNSTNHPEAVEVREIIRQMMDEKAKLQMLNNHDVREYIAKHRGTNDTTGQQVLPLSEG
jgi:hypothetical protein